MSTIGYIMNPENHVTHEEIQQRAYVLWEQAGHPAGCENEHWFRAESELTTERNQAERFRENATPTTQVSRGADTTMRGPTVPGGGSTPRIPGRGR